MCTDSFQAGFPNRFLCVFCTSLWYFRRIPTPMQPKSVSFSSPLACSSCIALRRICCHCHYQHVFLVSPGSVYRHLVKYGFSLGATIRSRTLQRILYEQNPSTMKCSRGQLRNNGACFARENARVRFQLRTAFILSSERVLGNGVRTHLNSSTGSSKEGWTRYAATHRTASPANYRLSLSSSWFWV